MRVFSSSGSIARRKSIYALAGAVAVMLAAEHASATNFTWTNGGANGVWDLVSNNWNAGAGNTVWLNNDAAPNAVTFDSGVVAAGTVTISGTTTSTPMKANGITFVQGGWTLAGGFLQGSTSTTSGTLAISDTGSNTITSVIQDTSPTITTAVTLSGTGTTIFSGASTYTGGTTITGTITTVSGVSSSTTVLQTGNAGAADLSSTVNTLTVNGGALRAGTSINLFNPIFIGNNGMVLDPNAGTVTIDGVIADAPSSSNGGLIVLTGGVINLERDSTFSGGLTLQGGSTTVDHAQHYTGNTTLLGSAQIRLGGNNVIPVGTDLSIQSTGGFQLRSFNQTVAQLDSAGSTSTSRFVAQTNGGGSGGVMGSTITVTGTSTFGGKIGDAGNGVANGVTFDHGEGGNGIGGGFTALAKTGPGILTLTGPSSRYTGGTTISSGGTILLGSSTALGEFGTYATNQPIAQTTVNATATLDLGGQAIYNSVHLNGGTLSNSSATAATVNNGIAGVSFSSPSGNFEPPGGSAAVFTGGGGTGASTNLYYGVNNSDVMITDGGAGYTSAPTFTIQGNGGTFTTSASGTTTIDGSGHVTSLIFTNPGAGYSGTGPTGITFTGGGGTTVPTVQFGISGVPQLVLVGMGVVGEGGGFTSAPTVTFSTSTLDATTPTATTTVVMSDVVLDADSFIGSNAGNITLKYGISGTAGFTKIGTDTLALLIAPSSYGGNTTVSGGTLQIGLTNALPGTTTVTVSGGATAGGTLDLAGQSQSVTGLAGGSGTVQGLVTNSAGATSTLTVTGTSQFDGLIQNGNGMVALVKSTAGVLTLTNANTYSGNTDVTGGTLVVSNSSGSATGTGTVTMDGGVLSGHGSIAGAVSAGAGAHTIFPSATLSPTSTGTLTMGGLTTGSGTTLQFNLVTPGNGLLATTSNSDAIAVTGSNGLVLNGGTVNLTNHSTGAASLGFYKVIAYSGTIGGTGLSSLTLPATVANVEYTFDTTHDAGFVDIHRGFAGDVDDSGFVDINDLAILAAHWQQTGGWAQGNFLGDPLVDINDLAILAANWQTGITSFGEAADSLSGTSESFQQAVASVVFGGVSSVPEPTSLALLGMGAAGLLSRRRRR